MRTLPRPRNRRLQRRITPVAAVLAVLATVLSLTPSPSAEAATLPVPYSLAHALIPGNVFPNTPPPGANDWSCKPTTAHPRPVILIHATLMNMRLNWDTLSPLLYDTGYCVYALNYGANGVSPVNFGEASLVGDAQQLSAFVDRVLAATGAHQVDIVGHSQGGMMPRYYLNYLGGAPKVHILVGLGPTNHGGTVGGIVTVERLLGVYDLIARPIGQWCPACTQQIVGSPFLADLNAGGDTVPGVHYTVIATRYDEFASPYPNDFLTGPNVSNITLQTGCPLDLSGHIHLAYDPRALALVLNALDPQHPRQVPCLFEPWLG